MSRGSAEPEELKRIASELQKEVDTMAKAVAERSMEELIQADYRFHQIIIREGGNKLFFDIFQTLHSFMQEEIRKTFTDLDDLADVTRDHGQILGYIKSGNIEKAVKRHNAHFVRIKKLLTPGAKPTLD
jgi:DNA-binding GntR family transcriptional regulator